ncbi:hypothetical protein [Streptomyces sp. MBT27]|uniref:hypothetical protein n=1 Tax=Streptomyces sp. MBT27 TaxID=1488356 RepID=UPI00141DAA9E|nr:hypothetical protein [Streptomyces sp. MBT27]
MFGSAATAAALITFFLGMLIHAQLRSDSSARATSLLTFVAIAIPDGLLAWWLAGHPPLNTTGPNSTDRGREPRPRTGSGSMGLQAKDAVPCRRRCR